MSCSQVLIIVYRQDTSPLLSLDNTTCQEQKTPQDSSSHMQRTLLTLAVRKDEGDRQVNGLMKMLTDRPKLHKQTCPVPNLNLTVIHIASITD